MRHQPGTVRRSVLLAPVLGLTLALSPVFAQNVPAELAKTAEEECIRSAEAKGLVVKNVDSIEPRDGAIDAVNVVLSVERDGQPARLTCGYSTAGAVFDDDTSTTTSTTSTRSTINPWFILLPLLALPFLIWWWGNNLDRSRGYARRERADSVVRSHGRAANVHSGPDNSYDIIGSLNDGQRVALSGLFKSDWAELAQGGWVRSEHLESIGTRHTTTR
ncbi:MAG: hypothetical protein ACRC8A_15650 [Microcoleaceae cyanobacterium]